MFVTSAVLKIVCELALVGGAGLVAMLAFVVLTVDRLNVRVAELEAQLADRKGPYAEWHFLKSEHPGIQGVNVFCPPFLLRPPSLRTGVSASSLNCASRDATAAPA